MTLMFGLGSRYLTNIWVTAEQIAVRTVVEAALFTPIIKCRYEMWALKNVDKSHVQRGSRTEKEKKARPINNCGGIEGKNVRHG